MVYIVIRGLSHDAAQPSGCHHFRLLRHPLAEVSGGECRVALRYHPCRQVRHEVQALEGYNRSRHQVTGREERVLQVGGHRLLAGGYRRQVLDLDAQHNVKEQQHIEAHEVEHRPVEMYRQVACQPLRPSTFPFRQDAERPLYRPENRQHTQQDLLAVDCFPLANVLKRRENKNR